VTSYTDLDDLYHCVDGLSGYEIQRAGQELYEVHCVGPGVAGETFTHDGELVRFYPDAFEHAFFKAASASRRGIAKDEIDDRRVSRTKWIVPVVSGLVQGTECWRIREWDHYRKPPPEKRLYVVREETYIVWLVPQQRGGFYFKSAYPCGYSDIDRYTDRQRLIWSN
jgi:hypothetical protein